MGRSIPSILQSSKITLRSLLPPRSATLNDQSIQLEVLAQHGLPLFRPSLSTAILFSPPALIPTYLQHLEVILSACDQSLDMLGITFLVVLAERIARASLGVFTEVVSGETVREAEEVAVLSHPAAG